MSKKNTQNYDEFSDIDFAPGVSFARKAICWWLPILYLLVSDSFYLRTYDSAQVKITLLQMGGIGLLGLWVSLLSMEGRKAFRGDDFVFLAPFFAYLAYVLISFFHAPYKGASVDDFVRYILYMSVTLIVLREFSVPSIDRLTKILLITAYIAVLYGLVQFLDIRFFPPKDQGAGLDPFVWRQAFGHRTFSTYGNPNFFGDFLVLILPIAVAQYLKKRSFYLIPLIFLNLLCLYGTETKGAWLGFGISSFIFAVFYGYFFLRDKLKGARVKFLLGAAVMPIVAFIGVAIFLAKNPISISFRVATWLSTWEMIETHPLIGTGVGSFKIIYPAFRRPTIFHIEGKHNTETDHAEDEHIEEWMDNGLIGFGLYIWIIAFVTTVGLRGLEALTGELKGSRPPPAAYDLLGYLTAFLAMLIHNSTDVSLRFVSSGVFFGLLPGVIVNLARGQALWELHYKNEQAGTRAASGGPSATVPLACRGPMALSATEPQETEAPAGGIYTALLWAARAFALGALAYLVFLIFSEFSELQGPLRNYVAGGEVLQWWISWGVLLSVVVFFAYAYSKILLKGAVLGTALAILLVLWPTYYFWGWFKGDVYHNMAIFFSKQGKWEDAITYYKKVNKFDKYFVMPYYFVGNVFNDRLNMERQYRPDWGDENGVARTDFERAMASYEIVRAIAPNYVQMHHQVGTLYMKMFDYLNAHGQPQEAQAYLDKALARLNLYENLDPVYPFNYYRKAQIYINRKQFDKAETEYLHNLNGWKCYIKGHLHATPEAYTNLANVRYAMGKFKEAAEDYQEALKLDPNSEPAKRNLGVLQARFGVNIISVEPGK
ncbi:MAG: tetratricopeptide repeat protein [Elusimicrobia bacterium]|nr:tetratricopeptide repeat protein [Elusimicrobiota bacterium]